MLTLLWAAACQLPVAPERPRAKAPVDPLWRAPEPADSDPQRLRLEPRLSVAPLGAPAALALRGVEAAQATCDVDPTAVPSPTLDGVVDVTCRSGELEARAQVTFTSSHTRPLAAPYAGGV